MTDAATQLERTDAPAQDATPLRFVTAASLFDGHDAAINIMRRLIQQLGAEVIHLGHNRSVEEVVNAALQEDAHGIAISSYQGGHVEYFQYMVDMLRQRGGEHIRVFGGGGGVIVPEEIKALHAYGVNRIYSPHDGQKLGLEGMIKDMLARARHGLEGDVQALLPAVQSGDRRALARAITLIEKRPSLAAPLAAAAAKSGRKVPVLGITGTGGAGKSSVSDELIRRFRLDQNDQLRIAVIAVDPSRRKSGGALLGDRIRMNAINHPNIFFRSLATREGGMEISPALPGAIAACKAAGFDLIFAETAGIGQGDAAVVEHADVSLYVMTPEFGAASQLEKIDMLDFADVVAVNKFDRRGAEDAVRDVSKQVQRNKGAWSTAPSEMPVFGTIAARFNDDGVTALYFGVRDQLEAKGLQLPLRHSRESGNPAKAAGAATSLDSRVRGNDSGFLSKPATKHSTAARQIVPGARARYLAEIADTVRGYRQRAEHQAQLARERQHLR